jgi:hypothetical protein
VTAACLAAALVVAPLPSFAAKMVARSGEKPCREAINGLISLIDSNSDNTALYRDTFAVVVNTCGPVSPAPKPKDPPPEHDPEKWKPVFREDHAPPKISAPAVMILLRPWSISSRTRSSTRRPSQRRATHSRKLARRADPQNC